MRIFRAILISAVLLTAFPFVSEAQFRSEAFQQQYNDDKAMPSDSTDVLFSFKDFFGGLAHKHEIKSGVMFAGSFVFLGASQIYNKDYWKLPIVYGGIGAGLGVGFGLRKTNPTASTIGFAAAGLTYWGSLLDGIICYKPDNYPHPGKATIYAILVPGLGQIYNREYWKLPIYLGGMVASYYFYSTNKVNYERFRRIYKEATDETVPYTGPISANVALYYRDVYRRYRDYSVLAFAACYLLQIIDANVFSYMHNFNITDDLAVKVTPSLIAPELQFASSSPGSASFPGSASLSPMGFGLNASIRF